MLLKFATRDTGVFDGRSPHPETLKLLEQSGAGEELGEALGRFLGHQPSARKDEKGRRIRFHFPRGPR